MRQDYGAIWGKIQMNKRRRPPPDPPGQPKRPVNVEFCRSGARPLEGRNPPI